MLVILQILVEKVIAIQNDVLFRMFVDYKSIPHGQSFETN